MLCNCKVKKRFKRDFPGPGPARFKTTMDSDTMRTEIASLHRELADLRRDLHRHPELAFEEQRTGDIVAEYLGRWGVEIHRGIARTGVVGVLRRGPGPEIALRADMDALPIQELGAAGHRSSRDGVMHACGHDGHITMLLGAARCLAGMNGLNGTVYFIFQPAEENEGGGRELIADGLFERFPAREVYGLHNVPGLPAGTFATRPGPLMAAIDTFEIQVAGRGTHAAMPHKGVDPLVTASEIVLGLQTIVARELDPLDHAVVSATQVHGGDTWNVIPETAVIRGCIRYFSDDVGLHLASAIGRISSGVAAAHGGEVIVRHFPGYPALINSPEETRAALKAACAVAGETSVEGNALPVMASEDFAYLLSERPGCYMFIGNGTGENHPMVHSPHYDFNDEIIPAGVEYWVRLVKERLGPDSCAHAR